MTGGSGLLGQEIGATGIRPQTVDDAGNVLSGTVSGVPSNGLSGFTVSCILQRTAAAGIYVNKGTTASATWSAVTLP